MNFELSAESLCTSPLPPPEAVKSMRPVIADNIHTHPHSFTSKVIKGGIRNHIYRVEDSVPETDYCVRSILFRVPLTKNDGTKTATIVRENVSYEKTVTFDTYEGREYQIHKSTMHMIDILEPKTITLLTCNPYIGASPETYFVMGKDVSYTKEQLHNTKSKSECWEIVADTLA